MRTGKSCADGGSAHSRSSSDAAAAAGAKLERKDSAARLQTAEPPSVPCCSSKVQMGNRRRDDVRAD